MVERSMILKWRELHDRWWMAEQLSRKVQGEIRVALEEAMLGGELPTRRQLDQLDSLQRQAERCRLDLDGLVIDVMS